MPHADTQSETRPAETTGEDATPRTTVEVRATGKVRAALPTHRMEYEFAGTTLRAFLEAFLDEYDVGGMLIAETESAATATGWTRPPDVASLPGTWSKNPEGEQTRPFVRVCVNGHFNEHLSGLDTELEDGDRVALIYPFLYCV